MADAAKVLVKIICNWIENIVKKRLNNDQYRSEKNKSTTEAILSVRILVKENKPIELNLDKAFDKVP